MIPKRSASTAILEQLAIENRRVLSDWRATILLRRATFALAPYERRWSQIPGNFTDIHPLLHRMSRRGEIKSLPHLRYTYEVVVPYARRGFVEESEVLMEVNPYSAISHLSALTFHNLTDELPQAITAIVPSVGTAGLLPLGTDPEDWEGLSLAPGRQSLRILNQMVHWIRIEPGRFFGTNEYRPHGYAVRVTTPERTLLDGLLQPDLCGGLGNVLRGWKQARDILDLDTLIDYVERFHVGVLRQRVGFVLDTLHVSHPALERWVTKAHRGGSSKLLASEPYIAEHDERWNLSINAPVNALHEDEP